VMISAEELPQFIPFSHKILRFLTWVIVTRQ
jgi:hypothetical protein